MAEVRLNIADMIVALEFANPPVASLVADYFRGFLTSSEPEIFVHIEWIDPPDLQEQSAGVVHLPQGRISDRLVDLEWDHYRGSYSLESSRGAGWVRGTYGLERFLWAIMSIVLPERDGLLVHAASVVRNGMAYVFPAPSGTGKSTLVRNSPECRVLSDDGSLLRFRNGRLYAYGSMFRSDNYHDFYGGRVPVAGVYFLSQAPWNDLKPISAAESLERLMPEIVAAAAHGGLLRQCFLQAERVLAHTATGVLELKASGGFWGCIPDGVAD